MEFKNSESLDCTPVIYIIFYTNFNKKQNTLKKIPSMCNPVFQGFYTHSPV